MADDLRPASGLEVILASGSPRRRDLLARLGVEVVVRPAHVDETARPGESVPAMVGRLARDKAAAIDAADALVIAADTAVVCDGDLLGKPADDEEAAAMLRRLSGRTHAVMTAVAARHGGHEDRVLVRTEVTFRAVTEREVVWHVLTADPMDKAGGYGLQGAAGAFVVGIDGSDTNVIGLPLEQTVEVCRRVGVDLLA